LGNFKYVICRIDVGLLLSTLMSSSNDEQFDSQDPRPPNELTVKSARFTAMQLTIE
jgi:hypothetical protein